MLTRLGSRARLIISGGVAGGVWYGFAVAFDRGVRDFNYPVIPVDNGLEVVAGWLAAAATGVVIAATFQKPMLSGSRRAFFALPILTLPIALTMFAALIWVTRIGLGSNEGALRLYGFGQIWGILFLYGMVSVFTPILYGLALATQWTIRRAVGRLAHGSE